MSIFFAMKFFVVIILLFFYVNNIGNFVVRFLLTMQRYGDFRKFATILPNFKRTCCDRQGKLRQIVFMRLSFVVKRTQKYPSSLCCHTQLAVGRVRSAGAFWLIRNLMFSWWWSTLKIPSLQVRPAQRVRDTTLRASRSHTKRTLSGTKKSNSTLINRNIINRNPRDVSSSRGFVYPCPSVPSAAKTKMWPILGSWRLS